MASNFSSINYLNVAQGEVKVHECTEFIVHNRYITHKKIEKIVSQN